MSAFRELRYGVMFFVCAMAGFVIGSCVFAGIIRIARTQPNMPADIEMGMAEILGVTGAIAGGLGWLAYKHWAAKKTSN